MDDPRRKDAPEPEGVGEPEPQRRPSIRFWIRSHLPGFLSAAFVGVIFLVIMGLGYLVLTSIILGTKRAR